MKVVFESKLVIEFELPGARYTSSGSMGGQTQLESRREEWWRLEVTADNAAETAKVFRALADEIETVRLKSLERPK